MQGIDNQTLGTIVTMIISIVVGAVLGGGTVAIVFGRVVKSILESPLLIRSFEVAAASWPAPVREAARDTGKLLEEVFDDQPTPEPVG